MSEMKTKQNNKDVEKFLNSIENEQKRKDSFEILELMRSITKEEPKMWGAKLIGFGKYHYKYKSGREGDWFYLGLSPGAQKISLHIISGFEDHKDLMKDLGKYKSSVSCLYINKLEDIDIKVLKKLLNVSWKNMKSGNNIPGMS
jgi:hypothetical protein